MVTIKTKFTYMFQIFIMLRVIQISILVIFACTASLNAQVVYNNYNITLSKQEPVKSIELDLFNDGVVDARIELQETASGDVFRFFTGSKSFVVSAYHYSVQVVKAFEKNDLMDGQWIKSNGGYVLYSEVQNIGLFDSNKDYFIAVRLQRDGKFHIGWINVRADFTKSYPSFKVLSSAIKETPGGLMYAGDFISSVNEPNIKELPFSLRDHILKIELPDGITSSGQFRLNIYNLQGRFVYGGRINQADEISLPLQLSGIYLIILTDGKSKYLAKVFL